VGAKTALVVLTEVLQFAVLITVAVLIGWRPPSTGWLPALVAAALGTLAFAGIGLLLAGTLPGLGTLAAANGLYLVLLLTGGMIVPLDKLPSAIATVAELLPAAALSGAHAQRAGREALCRGEHGQLRCAAAGTPRANPNTSQTVGNCETLEAKQKYYIISTIWLWILRFSKVETFSLYPLLFKYSRYFRP
jgi:hypothetical protein